MYLSLPVVDQTGAQLGSLGECLREFAKEENLRGNDRWFCPECKMHVDAVKQLSLWKAPLVLLVHLKRFRVDMSPARTSSYSGAGGSSATGGAGGSANSLTTWYGQALYNGLWCSTSLTPAEVQTPVSKKLSHQVHFDLRNLDLAALGALPAASAQKVPPVYDLYAIVDHFGSCGFGHYTATVWHDGAGWHRFNDEVVSPVSPEEVVSEKAYLLFFRQKEALVRTQTQSFPDAWPHLIEREWSFLGR